MSSLVRRLRIATALTPLALAGCTDVAPEAPAREASHLISDQLHNNGTQGFVFLPPMVPTQGALGGMVYGLSPTVRIDEITSSGTTVRTLASFTATTGPRGERTRVHVEGRECDRDDRDDDRDPAGYYYVRWDTDDDHLSTTSLYRVRVFVPARDGGVRELGFADVQVARNESQFRSIDRTAFTPLLRNSALRIKFRVDAPAVDQDRDGVFDWVDNCPTVANANQRDTARNGTGDACRCLGVTCTASDVCHARGTCAPTTGACSNPAAPDGTSCGLADASATCRAGACTLGACAGGWANCDGNAANGCETSAATTSNCGACGRVCRAGANASATCAAGACGVACATGYGDCDGDAANGCERRLTGDDANCGACGNACTLGTTCQSGACSTAVCAAGLADCDGAAGNGCEVALARDASNCGACGHACAFDHAGASCAGGACAIGACAEGWSDCNNDPTDGCETAPARDASNCGACGHACALDHAAATCAAGACAVGSCAPGYADCDGAAANGCESSLQADTRNCGGCGTACAPPHATGACAAGACAVGACTAGYADCDGDPANGCEVDLSSVASCGACGVACPTPNHATSTCAAGACGFTCEAGWSDCDGDPGNGCEVDLTTDARHCGACATACDHATTCQAGACSTAVCAAGFADCDGVATNGCESDLARDAGNCAACGHACSFANAAAACTAGACGFSVCDLGYADCDGSRVNGCEVNLTDDPSHCGGCGVACSFPHAGAVCAASACGLGACDAGWTDCDGDPSNGCETAPASDTAHCGACGHACPSGPHATATCAVGACGIACAAGYADCDGDPANGCERSVSGDAANCGACGNVCGNATTCQSGACTTAVCAAGHADCNGTDGDGCEVRLADHVDHCGACGHACAFAHASAVCAAGACGLGACDAGWSDCDGDPANGCEVDLSTNADHCGACATACDTAHGTPACASGTCAVGTCAGGWGDCDRLVVDGCETNLATDVSNCGACAHACPSAPHAVAVCAAGACGTTCVGGWADCDGDPGNGCEVNIAADSANCGACGNACGNHTTCQSSVCSAAACAADWGDCNANPDDGCEVDLTRDASHCGTCTTACAYAHATGACTASTCALAACATGFADCDASSSNGCETDLRSTVTSCGACGNACFVANGAAGCFASACGVAACVAGFANCNGATSDGCEVNIATSLANCGACGRACAGGANASPVCAAGSCGLACATGYGDCDGNAANGCERPLAADNNNCGACGIVCGVGLVCTAGACVPSCSSTNTTANCGSCGHACAVGQECSAGVCTNTVCTPIPACTGASCPSCTRVAFTENWESGSGAWHAADLNPIVIASEAAPCAGHFLRESILYSGGRLFTRGPIAVTGGRTYCLSAWVRAPVNTQPFLGIEHSDVFGHGGQQHWLIGNCLYPNDYGGVVSPLTPDGVWRWHSDQFTMTPGVSYVIVKLELFNAGAAGAADFDQIQLMEGPCPQAPPTVCQAATCP